MAIEFSSSSLKMLALLFSVASPAGTTADLSPPFHANETGKVGYWSLGGSALRDDNLIMLTPPIQFSRGSVWTNVEIPPADWSLQYEFKIHEGVFGGGMGFWFVDSYGSDGDLFGGSSTFQGLAILLSVRTPNRGSRSDIGLAVVQNPTKSTIENDDIAKLTQIIPFKQAQPLQLSVRLRHGEISVSIDPEGLGHSHEIYNRPLVVDLSANFIGVTAQCDKYTSRFDLHSIKFDIPELKHDRPASFGRNGPKSSYIPATSSALRNPLFVKTSAVLSENSEEPGTFTVLDIVDELTRVSHSTTSFKELNAFVGDSLIPYTQKWHRRTLKISGKVQEARNVLGAAWNYTHDMLDDLNRTFYQSAKKARFKIENIGQLFTSESERLEDEMQIEPSSVVPWVGVLAGVEMAVLVGFFALLLSRPFRTWLAGKL
jgi:hypothetical protein